MKMKYSANLLQYKGALFVLFSCFLFSLYYYLASIVPFHEEYAVGSTAIFSFYMQYLLQLLAPLFGWVADAWFGRYTLFLFSIIVGVLGCVLQSIALVLPNRLSFHAVQYLAYVVEHFSVAACEVYSLPFITDQMIGASGDELSAAVDWWFWLNGLAYLLHSCLFNLSDDSISVPLSAIIYCWSIALIVAGLILFKHWLVIHQQTTNPLTLVLKVLNYARKNKYPRNRSAMTYWENNFPSRIDLGKDKYGGPFTEENVEDVKTFLRLIPLIVIIEICSLFDDNFVIPPLYQHMEVENKGNKINDMISDEDVYFAAMLVICIPVSNFILKPLCPNLLTRFTMLKQVMLGLLLYTIGSLGFLILDLVGHVITPSAACMFDNSSSMMTIRINYYWAIIPMVICQASLIFMEIALKKFVIAQSPHQMKGLLFACVFGFNAIFHILGSFIHIPFSYLPHAKPSCGFYFYLTQTIVIIIILVLFTLLSRCYKLRQRNNPVNIHLIVGDHVEKYLVQNGETAAANSESDHQHSAVDQYSAVTTCT